MAQGLGAKAKKVFADMEKKPNKPIKDEYDEDYADNFSVLYSDDEFSMSDSSDLEGMFQNMMTNPRAITNDDRELSSLSEDLPGLDNIQQFAGAFKDKMFEMSKAQFTKEKIHPVLKDGSAAYAKWISENADRPTLSTKDKKRHQEACDMYHQMVNIFNKQKDTDSPKVKEQKSAAVYSLLIDAVQLGPLPESVVQAMGEFGTGLTSMDSFKTQPGADKCVVS